jgi:hypothetical protein
VSVKPAPPVSITVNGDTMRVYGQTNVQWFLDGNPIPGATTTMIIAATPGSYSVEVTDTDGCSATSNPFILGIPDVQNDVVEVYPNPLISGNWKLNLGNNLIGGTVEIFDAIGRKIYSAPLTNNHMELNLNVAAGEYLLRIYSVHRTAISKLVKL